MTDMELVELKMLLRKFREVCNAISHERDGLDPHGIYARLIARQSVTYLQTLTEWDDIP